MGDTIWLDVQGRPSDEALDDRSIMLRLQDHLDRLSDRMGVARLSDFYDYSEVEEEMADFVQELEANPDALADEESWRILGEVVDEAEAGADVEGDGEEGEPRASGGGGWFDPEPALAAVRGMCERLSTRPEDLGFVPDEARSHWPAHLLEELAGCRADLERAVAAGLKFRLLIVP